MTTCQVWARHRTYDVSADGQRFLVVSSVGEQYAPPRFIIVENWLEELRQGVPVK